MSTIDQLGKPDDDDFSAHKRTYRGFVNFIICSVALALMSLGLLALFLL